MSTGATSIHQVARSNGESPERTRAPSTMAASRASSWGRDMGSGLRPDQVQQFCPIVLDLGTAHAGNAGQQAVAGRADFRQFAQGFVMQDDVGRDALFAGG